jgi:hypothetical protein
LKVRKSMQHSFNVLRFLSQSTFLLLLLIFLLLNAACGNKTSKSQESNQSENLTRKNETESYPDDIKTHPFRNSDSTWGFNIYRNGKIYMHQQVMPGKEKATGFKSEMDADAAADVVIMKIRKHISPEILEEHDLDSLGLLKTKKNTKMTE